MKIAMAQMRVSASTAENLRKTLRLMEEAKRGNAELIFFPEIQLTPFFPQYKNLDASSWLFHEDGPEIRAICMACRELEIFASPNLFLLSGGKRYDASLVIDSRGKIAGVSKMVHIAQAEHFYEQDYYAPSEDGFRVYSTPFGKMGIVICFDRHLPDGIRSCAMQGAELVIIPTANLTTEPLELFEWEIRVQAFQNTVFIAMCNRVGREGEVTFAGESLLAAPDGSLLYKAGREEELILLDIPLELVGKEREKRPWLNL